MGVTPRLLFNLGSYSIQAQRYVGFLTMSVERNMNVLHKGIQLRITSLHVT